MFALVVFPCLANIYLRASVDCYVIFALIWRCKVAVNILSSLQWIISLTLAFTFYVCVYMKSLVLCVLENTVNKKLSINLKIYEQIAFERFLL